MKNLVRVWVLLAAGHAWATCVVPFEAVDEQGQALPTLKVYLQSESCQYKSEPRVANERGLGEIRDVPSDCPFVARGEFPGCVIQPVTGECKTTVEPLRMVCIEPRHVSLISVIASPAAFDGVYVRVTGVLVLEAEGDALYLDAASAKHHATKNAIFLDLRPEQGLGLQRSVKQYVTLTGRFNAQSLGHMNLFSGRLQDIL